MTPDAQQPQKRIRLGTATADDFRHATVNDWIEGVGDISTVYEQAFIRRFGEALAHSSTPAPAGYVITKSMLEELQGDANLFEISDFPKTAASLELMIGNIRSLPTPAPANALQPHCHKDVCAYAILCSDCPNMIDLNRHDAQVASKAREPVIAYLKMVSLKHGEMVDLMRRNGLKIDNPNDPMQKLAFTFFSEIGELSHKAEVILEENRSQL